MDNQYESYMKFWRESIDNGSLQENVDSDPDVINHEPPLWDTEVDYA